MLEALLQVCWDEYGMGKPDECTKKHANVKIENPGWVQLNSQVQIAGALSLNAAKDMSVSSDKADCSSLKKLLEVDTNNGSMHLDGLKALRKRLKTFMT